MNSMSKLIICNTYSQLMVAIQLKLTLLKDSKTDIWISDHSNNINRVIEPLKRLDLFSEVKYFEEREFVYNRGKVESFFDVIKMSFGKVKQLSIKEYDEIIFYSLSFLLYSISDYYKKIGHESIWSKMEEGVFSYNTDFVSGKRIKYCRKIRGLFRRYEIADHITNYYCYYPELKETNTHWNIIKIPSIKDTYDEYINVLNVIFDISTNCINKAYKYIYFASSSDVDGHHYGETELVLRLADKVGKNNVLVKMHPRDTRTVYQEYGIDVMEQSWIPWEVIQLTENLKETILVTVTSGAFISISANVDDNINGLFLYPEIKMRNKELVARIKELRSILNKLHALGLCCKIKEGTISELM